MDSSLGALLLNSCAGINLGSFLRSFCSWLAVVAAALSFWRIRKVKPNLGSHHHSEKPEEEEEEENSPHPETQEQKQIATTSSGEWEEDMHVLEMVTKGNKYKACYDYQMKEAGDHWQMEVEQWGRKNWKEVQVGMNDVIQVGIMKRSEMGWYRYQDLMVLDGSVVRLWDYGTRRR